MRSALPGTCSTWTQPHANRYCGRPGTYAYSWHILLIIECVTFTIAPIQALECLRCTASRFAVGKEGSCSSSSIKYRNVGGAMTNVQSNITTQRGIAQGQCTWTIIPLYIHDGNITVALGTWGPATAFFSSKGTNAFMHCTVLSNVGCVPRFAFAIETSQLNGRSHWRQFSSSLLRRATPTRETWGTWLKTPCKQHISGVEHESSCPNQWCSMKNGMIWLKG